jgi:quercetin dioxygenase-like cupin family protein
MEVQPRRPTAKAPAEWFTGDVWVDIIVQGQGPSGMTIGSVHFSPGARTAWHSHAISQTLYVTEGEGRVQSRGEPVVAIRPGDVVSTPGDEWHWHGASPDNFMTHMAMTEGAATWGEHVTDAEYHDHTE